MGMFISAVRMDGLSIYALIVPLSRNFDHIHFMDSAGIGSFRVRVFHVS